MSASESSPLLARQSSSISNTSSQKALSRSGRLSELRDDYNVAHTKSSQAYLPAAPVGADDSHELHDSRWAERNGRANYLAQFRYIWREELAECLGTAFIILFGASVECQTSLHYGKITGRAYSFGDYNSCRFAWAAGVACAVWVSGGISGGHCNPTVTLALWLYRGFPGRKVAWYMGAQVTGATLASLIVYSNYRYSIGLYEGQGLPSSIRTVTGSHATAPLFFTFPQPWLPASSAFLSEAIASGVLISVVFALSDKGNLPPPKGTMAFAMFIVLLGIGASMGVNTGYAMNGARDTGPRIALWILGYGSEIWSHNHNYWIWGPWIGAMAGGVIGAFIYDSFIYTGKDSWLNRPIGGGIKLEGEEEEHVAVEEGEQA
ncbi:hypothetical protein CBS101457_004189 [Exobasidium rhododendri]|nr:hypothetical protein CBS101457_004189 [Exobasidium rhododendri]